MPVPHTLLDPDGRPIRARDDGALMVSDASRPVATRAVVAMIGADGGAALLVEADGGGIRLRPEEPTRSVVGLRIDGVDRAMVLLREGRDGPFLRFVDGGVRCDADVAADAARFRLAPQPEAVSAHMTVAALPADLCFDLDGLIRLFGDGDGALLPLLAALLPTLPIEVVRDAWAATPRRPQRDVFHPLVRAQSRQRVRPFAGYTADLLAPSIEPHGWSIGAETYGNPRIMEAGRGRLTIGRYCSMADPCIVLGNHATRSVSSYPFVDLWAEWPGATVGMTDHVARDVVIGNDVWIGTDVVILPGAVIGDGAVIGAGAVVRGHVPPYAIYVGNPGAVRGLRFEPPIVARLLRLRWWDWPDARVDRALDLITSADIGTFVDVAEREDAGCWNTPDRQAATAPDADPRRRDDRAF